ncbi:hypothetical protein CaCOL14_001467 [Colletotrichum acutatum]
MRSTNPQIRNALAHTTTPGRRNLLATGGQRSNAKI